MSAMITHSKGFGGARSAEPSILLASDAEDQGRSVRSALEDAGFRVQLAGDYSRLEEAMDNNRYDLVLLEVSSEQAVEPAVEAALRVKRARAGQFVGYVADPSLNASGLGGDGIFPRSVGKLPDALRSRLAGEDWGHA